MPGQLADVGIDGALVNCEYGRESADKVVKVALDCAPRSLSSTQLPPAESMRTTGRPASNDAAVEAEPSALSTAPAAPPSTAKVALAVELALGTNSIIERRVGPVLSPVEQANGEPPVEVCRQIGRAE